MTKDFQGGFDTEDRIQVCGNQTCTGFFRRDPKIFNILFFEFWGMVLFSYVVIYWNGITSYPGFLVTEVGMFFSLLVSGSFGCGYLNPALILACMIRKENRISILHGIIFWLVEYVAAFAGTFLAWSMTDTLTAPFPMDHPTDAEAIHVMWKELLGSFMFLLGVLIIISSDTTFARNSFQVWICVPLCLIAVCVIFNLGLGTNPAQAIAFQTAYFLLSPRDAGLKVEQMSKIWSVIVGATLGGAVAGVFFQFVYKPYSRVHRQELLETGDKPIKLSMLNKTESDSQARKNRMTDIEMS